MSENHYKVVSLFSGAGGLDAGFHRTGSFKTWIACEKLPQAVATLAYNLGLETIYAPVAPTSIEKPIVIQGEVEGVDFSNVELEPDVLIGGPPCQDFSIVISKPAKTKARPGLNSGRGKLYVEFVRALMFLQPKVFVFENVPGLLSANDHLAYKTILNDLQNLEVRRAEALELDSNDARVPSWSINDYDILFSDIVNTQVLGVPQTRRRLIIIGIRRDLHQLFDVFEQQAFRTDFEALLSGRYSLLSRFPLTCMEVFEGQALPKLQNKYKQVMKSYESLLDHDVLPADAKWRDMWIERVQRWRERVWDKLTFRNIRDDYFLLNQIEPTLQNVRDYEQAMDEHERLLEELGWLGRPVDEQEFSDNSHRRPRLTQEVIDRMFMIPPDENHEFVIGTDWHVEGQDISFIYRRPSPLKPAWTVMAYGGGGTYGYHYARERAQLTLRERARIQTFSDSFLFQGRHVRAQIGEAVPPLLGQKIAEKLRDILSEVKSKMQEGIALPG